METCPHQKEVDRLLKEQGRHDQLAITTHADAMRALEGCRLETNEEGCASLLQNMLRYVCNSVAAAEAGLSSDRMFHDRLISWIQTTLPSLREAGASDYLVQLEAAVKKPRLTNGGQLQNPTPQDAHESPPASAGTAALPVARALNFTEFQHLPDRCEQCANPCNTAKYQGLRCACGAIVCSDCHGLTINATRRLSPRSLFPQEPRTAGCRGLRSRVSTAPRGAGIAPLRRRSLGSGGCNAFRGGLGFI